ncbi:MAG: hypothetical protein E7354_03485 [Clostridiales bacterium]|nr:hypothetical protein [Clostridiales bacterium]
MSDDFWNKLERDREDMEFMENNPSHNNYKRKKTRNEKLADYEKSFGEIDSTLTGKRLLIVNNLAIIFGIAFFVLTLFNSIQENKPLLMIFTILATSLIFITVPILIVIRMHLNTKLLKAQEKQEKETSIPTKITTKITTQETKNQSDKETKNSTK